MLYNRARFFPRSEFRASERKNLGARQGFRREIRRVMTQANSIKRIKLRVFLLKNRAQSRICRVIILYNRCYTTEPDFSLEASFELQSGKIWVRGKDFARKSAELRKKAYQV